MKNLEPKPEQELEPELESKPKPKKRKLSIKSPEDFLNKIVNKEKNENKEIFRNYFK